MLLKVLYGSGKTKRKGEVGGKLAKRFEKVKELSEILETTSRQESIKWVLKDLR